MFFSFILLGLFPLVIGFTPLKTLLTVRGIATSIPHALSQELVSANSLIGYVAQIHDVPSFDAFLLSFSISYFILFLYSKNYPTIYKWDGYYIINRHVRIFVLVFMTIMTKTLDSAI